jgi:hypothetical protein
VVHRKKGDPVRRIPIALGAAATATLLLAQPALACGGLVAPNGAVRLERTATLAAYHDGVERYVTSFQYAARQNDFGSIIPLPGVPTDVRRAGSWTLQRLERETHPVVPEALDSARASTAALAPAQVLLQTTVDALDITVLSGGGAAVLQWVKAYGYAVSPDAQAMLDFYARRSPVFLAARFNAAKARARGQLAGDGTPIQITIPTPNPWVPLHILSLAKVAVDPVQADVYLLTDGSPSLLGLDAGVRLQASEPASTSLLDDLRSDKDSSWVPARAWLTFVRVDVRAGQLTHDLAIDASGGSAPSRLQAGYDPVRTLPTAQLAGFHPIGKPSSANNDIVVAAVVLAAMLAVGLLVVVVRGRPH